MDLKAQEKAIKLIIEQADKLSKALSGLRQIKKMYGTNNHEASQIAAQTLQEIADYGKDPKDL